MYRALDPVSSAGNLPGERPESKEFPHVSSGMIIDGVFASEAIDSSGEILDVKGCDISDLENGTGVLNWEHRGDDAEGASANDIIGKIVFAKKIFGPEDCTDSRQLEYWQKIQLPLIYGIVRLFDGSGHPGAIAAAAILRDYQANNEPLLIRYSIEGTTLKKDKSSNRLLESVARRVAATIKPCNKSCHSGLIADPNHPNGETRKSENENPHPNFTPLGGSFEYEAGIVESESIKKALEAGGYNSAPGSLSGGSALQVEDRGLRNRVKAAVRDWDRKTPFKKFLKHRLPEASDEFIDRFSDLVQDYTIKKAQREALKEALTKKIEEKIKAKAKVVTTPEKTKSQKPQVQQLQMAGMADRLTIRGKPVNPNPEGTKTAFDEKKGILHTPRGSFPMYIPSRDKETPDAGQKFHNIMQDPKVTKFHDYAMENWSKLHQHLKAGTLPPEVIMHGVLFSQLSPNTPVPMQELMYAHLVDAMKATGKDPRSAEGLDVLRHDWLNRDQPQKWPEHSREHFQRLEGQLRMKNDSKGTGRVKGDIGGFMLANNKFKNMEQYHTLHNNLVALVGRHKHDARSAVEEMMFHKQQAKLWDAKRRRDIDKGKGDPGEYSAGPDIPGLAPKTARYTYGMLGGGNVMVPDTHFARYLFGLDRQKDTASIDYIKSLLWNTGNTHVLNGIDRYYAKHHDAVKHMQQHPVWGKHFENPEDAVFPAFWKNWVGILPHEAARGMKTNGWNESTDHRPFWEAIAPHLNKSEMDTNIAMRTAKMHHEWVQKYGEMPAMLMYFHYLVPQLLAAGEKRQQQQTVMKFEALSIELRKDQAEPAKKTPPPETVKFNGKVVKPGHATIHADKKGMYLLDHTPEHYVAVPEDKVYGWEASDLVKLPRKGEARGYIVNKPPEHLEEPSVLSHEVHGLPEYTHHPEVQEMIHGLDLDPKDKQWGERGMNADHSFWSKSQNGKRVYVKMGGDSDVNRSDFTEAHREALYHNLAKDFYGLGDYVTPTAVALHPRTGEPVAVIQHVEGEHHAPGTYEPDPVHTTALQALHQSGELHKLALMDTINGTDDRHDGNYVIGPDGRIKLIDHGKAFSKLPFAPGQVPHYLEAGSPGYKKDPVHPEAAKWVMGLAPEELELQMRRHGVPEGYIHEARRRLKAIQQHVKAPGATLMGARSAPFRMG